MSDVGEVDDKGKDELDFDEENPKDEKENVDVAPGEEMEEDDAREQQEENTPAPAQEEEEPESLVKGNIVNFKRTLLPNESVQYLTVTKSLSVDTHPFSKDHFLETEKGDFPWRVIRWRSKEDGSMESNTRLVTWSDGSQTVHIGKDTVFSVSRQAMRRGTNDLTNVCVTDSHILLSHFAQLNERLVFRLDKEPVGLKKVIPDRKIRKVKVVMGVSQREEERQLAEEDKKRSKSLLEKQKERKQRQASSATLDKNFLEEGTRGEEDEYEQDFVQDADEGATNSKKRGREPVQEDAILRAKRGVTSKSAKQEVDDDIQIFDSDDEDLNSFIDDGEDEAKGVIGSDDDDDE